MLARAPDPIEMAGFAIPVIGEYRAARWLAGAGESVLARAAVRGGIGAIQGTAGTVALQPLDYMAYSMDGRDYTFADALTSIAANAGIGGVLHAGGGALADVWRGFRGRPVYPFAEGEPYARAPGEAPSLLPTETAAPLPPPPAVPLTPGAFPEVDTLLAHPEVAGQTTFPKYGFNVSDILNEPRVAEAIERPDINRADLASNLPSEATIDGVTFDPAAPLNVAHQVRQAGIERHLEHFRREHGEYPDDALFENILDFVNGHYATPAEKAWVLGHGIDWNKYQEAKYAWHGNPAPARIEPGPAIWANQDFSFPVEVANEPPQMWPDGRWYQRVRHEGREVHIPANEIQPAAVAKPPPRTGAVPLPRSSRPVDTAGGIAALREATKGRLSADELQRLDDLYARPEYAPDLDQLQERAAAPLDRPIVVHRGAKSEEQLLDSTSYISTSDREHPARTFARNVFDEKQGLRAEIHVEPGVTAFVPDSGITDEVVLAPGTRYEITGRRTDPETGQEVLTVVARPPAAATASPEAIRAEWQRVGREVAERELLMQDEQALREISGDTGESIDAMRARLADEQKVAREQFAALDAQVDQTREMEPDRQSVAAQEAQQRTDVDQEAALQAALRGELPPVTVADAMIPREFRAQPIPGPLPNWIGTFAPNELLVDARRFQFKSGGDEFGVSERLEGVTKWDQIKSGISVVWQDTDGRYYIVDGHQRLALARRIAAEDPAQNPVIVAYVFRASQRTTDRKVRTIAALKNIAEGTGTAVDAAKVLRDEPALVDQLPPRSDLVRQARGLANLSDDAFLSVVDERVPANYAAVVGRLVPRDAELQRGLLHVLESTDPSNVVQAEAIVRQGIEEARAAASRAGLFNDDAISRSLYLERAKVLDLTLKDLKRDKVVFAILSKERGRIEEVAGNILAAAINEKRLAADARAIQLLQILAGRAGPVNDALDAAARRIRDGAKREDAVRDFVTALRRLGETGDLASLADGVARSAAHVGDESAAGSIEQAPEQPAGPRVEAWTAAEIRDATSPAVNPATGSDDILAPSESQEVLKGAIASLIEGRPVRAGEQIDATRGEGKRRRGKRQQTLTPREAWEQLANELLPHDEPAVIAASRAAEAMGEPASVATSPAVRAKAAEKLGAETAEQFERSKAFIATEEEREDRALFESAIEEHAQEQQRKADVIKQGAACLMSGGFATGGSPPPPATGQTPPPPNDTDKGE